MEEWDRGFAAITVPSRFHCSCQHYDMPCALCALYLSRRFSVCLSCLLMRLLSNTHQLLLAPTMQRPSSLHHYCTAMSLTLLLQGNPVQHPVHASSGQFSRSNCQQICSNSAVVHGWQEECLQPCGVETLGLRSQC